MKTLPEVHDVVEGMIQGIVMAGMSPREIMVGISNAFVHGECLEKIGLTVPEESLKKLFEGFELSIQAMKEIEQASGLI